MICESVEKTVGVRARALVDLAPDQASDGSAVRGGSGDDKSKRQKRAQTRRRQGGAIEKCARRIHDGSFIPVLTLQSQASYLKVRRCALH
jgi:hypothetical protein